MTIPNRLNGNPHYHVVRDDYIQQAHHSDELETLDEARALEKKFWDFEADSEGGTKGGTISLKGLVGSQTLGTWIERHGYDAATFNPPETE